MAIATAAAIAVACGDSRPRGLVSSTSQNCPAPVATPTSTTGEPPPTPGTGSGSQTSGGTSGSNTGGGATGVTPRDVDLDAVVDDCTNSGVPGGTSPIPNQGPVNSTGGTSGTSSGAGGTGGTGGTSGGTSGTSGVPGG